MKSTKLSDKRRKRLASVAFIIIFILIGGYMIYSSFAATGDNTLEPENGIITSPAVSVTDSTASGTKAVKFSSNTNASCTSSNQHVPDGPDGTGGCWPGPSNTGPNALESTMTASVYSGSNCTVNTPNVTIDSKIVNCSPLYVGANASGLLIKNSYLKGGVIQPTGTSASFTIQDSVIDNNVQRPACSNGTCTAGLYACGDLNNATFICGVGYKNFTILRSEVMHTNRGAYCANNCLIQDSYFHGTNLWPDPSNKAHASGVRNEQYLTLRHNSLSCDYPGPYPNSDIGCSADMSGYPDDAPIMHDTIDKNLFIANPSSFYFCAYGGNTNDGKPYFSDPNNATYIVFTNNIFQRGSSGVCGDVGGAPIRDFALNKTGNVWTNNKYDNGTIVNPN